ncbi:TonB-dependent receptor [Novosphingobium terrae]|uniref:TonB-dependent receptor n=1 Tax=Novosphingobium terrae TaxID=2726189 RepID=UPI00197CD080|nr:TonB-dependent receptor [Novosphingobium terrae]
MNRNKIEDGVEARGMGGLATSLTRLRGAWLAGGAMVLAAPGVAYAAQPPAEASPAEAAPAPAAEAPPAEAEEAPPAPPPVAGEGSGNEILVTATKHEQTLQNVPVAVTVTTAETLNRAKIRDIADLASVVPSLRVNEHQTSANTSFLIRGFGNGDNNAGLEPSVGVFIDGVYRSRSAAQIADFPDVTQVEVLRGPQSTLFGKNASAGVVSITTQEPQFKTQGSAELSYGNYNAFVAKANLTGKIAKDLAGSIAGGYNRRDGYVYDAGTNSKTNNRNRWYVKGQLLYAPDNGPRVRIIGDYGKIDELCCATMNVLPSATTAAIQAIGGKVNPASDPYSTLYNNLKSTNNITNYGVSAQIDDNLGPVKLTSITAWRKSLNYNNQDSDFTSADLLSRNAADVHIRTFTQEFRANLALGDFVNLLGGASYFNEKIDQIGQLQYGSDFRNYANLLVQQQSGGAFSLPAVENLLGALSGNPSLYSGKFFQSGTGLNEAYALKDESFSIFGQADVKFGKLTVTGGISYTHDAKRFSTNVVSNDVFSSLNLASYVPGATQVLAAQGVPNAGAVAQQLMALHALQVMPPFLNVPNAVEPGHVADGNVSYTGRLAYQLNPHINLYGSYVTGWKAASVNLSRDSRPALADAPAIAAAGLALNNLTYGSRYALPENSRSIEFGLKANWGIATANIAVFHQTIKNFQTNQFDGTGFALLNAEKESVYGFEFEGTVHVGPEVTIGESLTYLRPKYDSFVNSSFGDISGSTPAGIPPISSTAVLTWDHPFANGHHLIFRGDWHYEAPTQIEDGLPGFITTNPLTGAVVNYQTGLDAARAFKREVSEIDASLSWKLPRGLELSVWGRNLTDDRYINIVFDSPAQAGSVSGYPNQPRTYGVSALYKF